MKANQCNHCGKYCKYEGMDSYTRFGCANPEAPEPYDPVMLCASCARKLYEAYLAAFKKGSRSGDWMKSDAECKAAKECGLVWIHDHSVEINGKKYLYQWLSQELLQTKKEIN